MKHIDVTKKNENYLLQHIYNNIKISGKPKYKIGEYVRISKHKHIFEKGYEHYWSTEILLLIIINIQIQKRINLKIYYKI